MRGVGLAVALAMYLHLHAHVPARFPHGLGANPTGTAEFWLQWPLEGIAEESCKQLAVKWGFTESRFKFRS